MEVVMRVWMLILGSMLAGTTLGCGPSGAALCAAKCDCEGCSDREYDECLDDDAEEAARADSRGCLYEYDTLVSCEYDTGFCEDRDDWETSCGRERDDYRRCMN
jgi:hypothetical protein